MGRERSPITDRRRNRSRSRSRSPVRSNRKRSRSPRNKSSTLDRKNRYDDSSPRRQKRSRSRSRSHDGSKRIKYTPDNDESSKHKNQTSKEIQKDKKEIKPKPINLDKATDCEEEMMKIMGFGSFDTTKNKKVEGNDVGCVNVKKSRKYRQYMNRKGGFNRPLDFIA